MKKLKRMFVICTCGLMLTISAGAAWSSLYTRMVPRWGAWSDPTDSVKKTDEFRYGQIYLNTAPHTFPLYGDLLEGGVRSTKTYYKLSLQNNVNAYYSDNLGATGSYQQSRVSSSNYEPDARNVTFKFKP